MSSKLAARNITKTYHLKAQGVPFFSTPRDLKALSDVSFEASSDEIVGIVGESGCGKSTLGNVLVQLLHPVKGEIELDGRPVSKFDRAEQRQFRRRVQMVFQHPHGSINPLQTARSMLREVLVANGERNGMDERVTELFSQVGLSPDLLDCKPAQLSGGQCQRLSIARALAMRPDFLICDEAIAALDVSIQAQIINLLRDLHARFKMGIIFISHDLNVVRLICDRVYVLYLGKVVELGTAQKVLTEPEHPYTKALIEAIPHVGDSELPEPSLAGEIPSPLNLPKGCALAGRCPVAFDRCSVVMPEFRWINDGGVACHLSDERISAITLLASSHQGEINAQGER